MSELQAATAWLPMSRRNRRPSGSRIALSRQFSKSGPGAGRYETLASAVMHACARRTASSVVIVGFDRHPNSTKGRKARNPQSVVLRLAVIEQSLKDLLIEGGEHAAVLDYGLCGGLEAGATLVLEPPEELGPGWFL